MKEGMGRARSYDHAEAEAMPKGVAFQAWTSELSTNIARYKEWAAKMKDRQYQVTISGRIDRYVALEEKVNDLRKKCEPHLDDSGVLHTSAETLDLVREATALSSQMDRLASDIIAENDRYNDSISRNYPVD